MLILTYLFILIYLIGIFRFSINRKHLLLILLSLEFIVLSLFFGLMVSLIDFNHEFFFCIIFLTIRVCEGALGLSILVSLIRSHGDDYFSIFNIL